MKKIGRYLLCFLPLLVYIVVQIVGGLGGSVVAGVLVAANDQAADMITMQQKAMEIYLEMVPKILCVIHLTVIVVGAIWFYLLSGKKKPGNPAKIFSWMSLLVIVFCAIGVQYVCTGALMVIQGMSPGALDNYSQMMQNAGLGDQNLFSILAAVCMAPVGEELLFRGITMNFARKAGAGFWIANIIQAVFFGIAHLNLVQGIYAFFMGIIFGYICEKYHSLYASILLHAAVNFLGTFINPLLLTKLFGETAQPGVIASVVFMIAAAVILFIGFVLLNKDRRTEN